MATNQSRLLGQRKSKLLRYRIIKELYTEAVKQNPYVPLTKILEIYIVPKFPISRTTLYQALSTSINKELLEVEDAIAKLKNS